MSLNTFNARSSVGKFDLKHQQRFVGFMSDHEKIPNDMYMSIYIVTIKDVLHFQSLIFTQKS